MKNVIVFTAGKRACAVELGWIREIFTLGHVTPVPLAPNGVAGVVNFRGAIVAIIDVLGHNEAPAPCTARQGESALLLEVDRCQAALRIGTIDEVSSLRVPILGAPLRDSLGREVQLLCPATLFERVSLTTHTGRAAE